MALQMLCSDNIWMAIHVHWSVNFDIFKWLYLVYYWVLLFALLATCTVLICLEICLKHKLTCTRNRQQ